jgi:hypothetical protein
MQCCPLSGNDDGDSATCYSESVRTARKEHACGECDDTIKKGERYEYVSGIWDGRASSYKTCLLCVEIRSHFACGKGWLFGELWSDLRENFFPDMAAGGPCMTGLSPAAKAKLIDMRMEWYLAQDESRHDDRWDGDAWRGGRAPILTPAFVPPAYAMLEYEPCQGGDFWTCRVAAELGVLRRGGLNERRTEIVARTVEEAEQRIRDAERWCRKVRRYAHAESIVPNDPQEDLHG